MARIRSLKPEFWDDRKLARATSRDARMLYMGLWNQADEHSRVNGDELWLKGRIFPYDDDITPSDVRVCIDELVAAGRVQRYEVAGDPYLFLPKLAQHQRLEPSKGVSRYPAPEVGAQQSAPGADKSAQNPEQSASGADKLSLLYVAGSREHVASSMVVEPQRSDVDDLCEHLADRIEANGAKRPPVTDRWRQACRLMLDTDHRTPDQVRAAIDWCQDDEFWRANILSMPKLREKYDQLSLQARRGQTQPRAPTTQTRVDAALSVASQLAAKGL